MFVVNASYLAHFVLTFVVDNADPIQHKNQKEQKSHKGRKPPGAGILQFWARCAVTGERIVSPTKLGYGRVEVLVL